MAAKKPVHRCECKHTRIKFCQKCQVPHCLDCAMEWRQAYTYPWTYLNVNGATTGYGITTTGNSIATTSGSLTVGSTPFEHETTCSHSEMPS